MELGKPSILCKKEELAGYKINKKRTINQFDSWSELREYAQIHQRGFQLFGALGETAPPRALSRLPQVPSGMDKALSRKNNKPQNKVLKLYHLFQITQAWSL